MKRIMFLLFIFSTNTLSAQPDFNKKVLMSDGTALSTDIYLPSDTLTGYPTILIRTPYSKKGSQLFANHFKQCGYAVTVQDVRGKYASEGKFIPFINEYRDGLETLDWLESQKWCNGKVGMWGSSYLGYSSLILAQSQHQALKSIFTLSAWINGDLINSPGGALHQMLIIPWLLFEGQKTRQSLKGMDLQDIFSHTPLNEVVPNLSFTDQNGKKSNLAQQSFSNENFRFSQVRIPIFQLGGWFDFATNASINFYQNLRNSSHSTQQLFLGPWYHNQIYDENKKLGDYKLPKTAQLGTSEMLDIACKWFTHTLQEDTLPLNKVEYYILFKDQWKTSKKWPPENSHETSFYLSKDSITHNSQYNKELSSSFLYDPNDPFPTIGGANFHFFLDNIGIKQQALLRNKNDYLLFKSAIAHEDQTYAGTIDLELYIRSEGAGTDFTARLCKIDTAGSIWNLADGIARIKSHKTLTRRVRQIHIQLGNIAFEIKEGEALALYISGGNFPKYNRNPNTGVDPMDAIDFIPVQQYVLHSPKHPSKLILNQLKPDR